MTFWVLFVVALHSVSDHKSDPISSTLPSKHIAVLSLLCEPTPSAPRLHGYPIVWLQLTLSRSDIVRALPNTVRPRFQVVIFCVVVVWWWWRRSGAVDISIVIIVTFITVVAALGCHCCCQMSIARWIGSLLLWFSVLVVGLVVCCVCESLRCVEYHT